jgi:hypothetical protein
MSEPGIETIKQSLLAELEEDYEGLWTVLRRVKRKCPGLSVDDARSMTLAIISELLKDGTIVAGAPARSGDFIMWKLSPEDTTNRIAKEWQELGREPDIGDIVWFASRPWRPRAFPEPQVIHAA